MTGQAEYRDEFGQLVARQDALEDLSAKMGVPKGAIMFFLNEIAGKESVAKDEEKCMKQTCLWVIKLEHGFHFLNIKEQSKESMEIMLEESIAEICASGFPISEESRAEIRALAMSEFYVGREIRATTDIELPMHIDLREPNLIEILNCVGEAYYKTIDKELREMNSENLGRFLRRTIELYARIEAAGKQ